MIEIQKITDAAETAGLLGAFKKFCDHLTKNPVYAQNIRSLLHRSTDRTRTIMRIFEDRFQFSLSPQQAERMLELVEAFFSKKSYRLPIPQTVRLQLLDQQGNKCAFCGCDVGDHDPVDHIVPFKYVGDELQDNYQVLCSLCNSRKNARMDYQIRFLLQLV